MVLLGIDLETTGLDPSTGSILEIAARVLDNDLNVTASFDGVLGVGDTQLCQMGDYVSKMHSGNGLMYELANCTLDDFIKWAAPYGELMFLGNSVAFDRDWVKHHCPALNVSYRVIDVSSLRHLAEHIGRSLPERKSSTHRAAADIDACIEELNIFWKLKL